MKVKDLVDQIGLDESDPRRNDILYCPNCFGEYSANYGDYFLYPDEMELTCPECDYKLILVHKETTYKEIKL